MGALYLPIEEALEYVQRGDPIIVVDNPNRENEGDMFIAAEKITPAGIGLMRRLATGLICVPMTRRRLQELGLELMVKGSEGDANRCRFTVSVDYRNLKDNGMSDYDRSATIKALIDSQVTRDAFYRPGHVFPLRAEDEGVLKRQGHTEAAVDLAKLVGLYPAGVICEVIRADGEMSRGMFLENFAQRANLPLVSINDLHVYRSIHDSPYEDETTVIR